MLDVRHVWLGSLLFAAAAPAAHAECVCLRHAATGQVQPNCAFESHGERVRCGGTDHVYDLANLGPWEVVPAAAAGCWPCDAPPLEYPPVPQWVPHWHDDTERAPRR